MDAEPKRQTLAIQEIHFANGNTAQAVFSPIGTQATDLIQSLGISQPGAIIMIAGGAFKMERQMMFTLAASFTYGIPHLAAALDALIIDGGTKAGVMELIGLGVTQQPRRPFLLGVTPLGMVTYPGKSKSSNQEVVTLDPNHSHFVLVEADKWGEETEMMYELAHIFSQGCPSVALLINGGGIAKREVLYCVRQRRPIVVLEGSGRVADEVANALRSKSSSLSDSAIAEIVADGDLHLFPVTGSVVALEQLMERLLR